MNYTQRALSKLKMLQSVQKELHFPILRAVGIGSLISLLAGGCLTYYNSKAYWTTRKRVQTVDFHILFHQLPYKLSALELDGNKKEIQKLLDSSNGFFGLVVTDCKNNNQKCSGEKILYSTNPKERWRFPKLDELYKNPYDILKDPPPILTEKVFDDPRSNGPTLTNQTNPGNIIGRVYYIRGIYNNPIEDVQWWIKKGFFVDSGAGRTILASAVISLMLGTSVVLGIEVTLLVLKKSEEKIKKVMEDLNLSILRSSTIADENRNLSQRLEDRTKQLEEAKKQIQTLQTLDPENESLKDAYQKLSEVFDSVNNEKNNFKEKAINWDNFLKELQGLNPQDALKKINAYDEIQKEGIADNKFEQKIIEYLINNTFISDKQWVISSGVDLGEGHQRRAQTDIIVSTEHSVFILEAKHYKGKITSESPRNDIWFSNKYPINKGQNKTPYGQLCYYSDQARRRLDTHRTIAGRVFVFGLVVFPQEAGIEDIAGKLGTYYDVVTLSNLLEKLITLNKYAAERSESTIEPIQLDKILKGNFLVIKNSSKIVERNSKNEDDKTSVNRCPVLTNSEDNFESVNKSSDYKNEVFCSEDSANISILDPNKTDDERCDFIVNVTESFKEKDLKEWKKSIYDAKLKGISSDKIIEEIENIFQSVQFRDFYQFKLVAALELDNTKYFDEFITEIGNRQKNITNIKFRSECVKQYLKLVEKFGSQTQKQQAIQRCLSWINSASELSYVQDLIVRFFLGYASKNNISSFVEKCRNLLISLQPLSQSECKIIYFVIKNIQNVSQACQLINLTLDRLLEFREISGIWHDYINLVNEKGGKETKKKLKLWLDSQT